MATKRVTLDQVAKAAKTSPATVSFVLNGRAASMGIPDHTRRAVQAVIQRLGYQRRPRKSGAAGNGRQAGSIAVIYLNRTADSSHQHFQPFYYHTLVLGGARGFSIHADLGTAPEQLADLLNSPALAQVGGVILPTMLNLTAVDVALLDQLPVPYVLCNRRCLPSRPGVLVDFREHGYRQAQKLLALGHRKIAYFDNSAPGNQVSEEQLLGVLLAAREHCASDQLVYFPVLTDADQPRPAVVATAAAKSKAQPAHGVTVMTEAQAQARAQRLLQEHPVTAIIAREDGAARILCNALAATGRQVGVDCSVISCGERIGAEPFGVTIDSITAPLEAMAQAALDMLEELLARRQPTPALVTLRGTDIAGQTIGPPRGQ